MQSDVGQVRSAVAEINKADRIIMRNKTMSEKEKNRAILRNRKMRNTALKAGSTQFQKARSRSLKEALDK